MKFEKLKMLKCEINKMVVIFTE